MNTSKYVCIYVWTYVHIFMGVYIYIYIYIYITIMYIHTFLTHIFMGKWVPIFRKHVNGEMAYSSLSQCYQNSFAISRVEWSLINFFRGSRAKASSVRASYPWENYLLKNNWEYCDILGNTKYELFWDVVIYTDTTYYGSNVKRATIPCKAACLWHSQFMLFVLALLSIAPCFTSQSVLV